MASTCFNPLQAYHTIDVRCGSLFWKIGHRHFQNPRICHHFLLKFWGILIISIYTYISIYIYIIFIYIYIYIYISIYIYKLYPYIYIYYPHIYIYTYYIYIYILYIYIYIYISQYTTYIPGIPRKSPVYTPLNAVQRPQLGTSINQETHISGVAEWMKPGFAMTFAKDGTTFSLASEQLRSTAHRIHVWYSIYIYMGLSENRVYSQL